MRLQKLILKNFRAYEGEHVINFNSNIIALIGKNDIGKSTILEALEIFFNGDLIKPEPDDLCIQTDDDTFTFTIGCVFEVDKNKEYGLDPQAKTKLGPEYILNKDGLLEIHKQYKVTFAKNDKRTITNSNSKIFIKAYALTEFSDGHLITKKNPELKNMLAKRSLTDSPGVDQRINHSIRQAIYEDIRNKNADEEPERQEIFVETDKEDAKKLFDYLEKDFPIFSLFQVDRENKDDEKEVQDPLKMITRTAIAEQEKALEEVTEGVKKKVEEMGKKTLEKLKQIDPHIAEGLVPDVNNKNWDTLFSFNFRGEDGIPLNKRGSGVRRLILFSYFRAQAEDKNTSKRNEIYAIEEPETSQHPGRQIQLIEAIQKLAEDEKRQFIITTHTPEFAKFSDIKSLILIKEENGQTVIKEDEEEKKQEIVKTLGILPDFSAPVLCVEGEQDIKFFEAVGEIKELKEIIDLSKIGKIALNGGCLTHWVERNALGTSNVKEFHIYDSDGKDNETYKKEIKSIEKKEQEEQLNKKENKRRSARSTKRRAIENYVPHELIEEHWKIKFTDKEKENWDKENIPALIAKRLNNKENEKGIKRIISKKIVSKITKESLEKIDAYDEIKEWFKAMKEFMTL